MAAEQLRIQILIHKQEAESALKCQSPPSLSNTPPANPHLLILPKLFHQGGTKDSNMCPRGPFSFKTPQPLPHLEARF